MLEEFWFNVKTGLNHVLDINGYDHILFLILLALPYVFKSWERLLILVSLFTVGHTLSLILSTYKVIHINGETVEFLIPITILITAIYTIFTASNKEKKDKHILLTLATLIFGVIHGLGFAREFNMISGQSENKLELLITFALGIELAQVFIVFVVLFLAFIFQTIFRCSKRDWILVVSATVLGLVLPMLF